MVGRERVGRVDRQIAVTAKECSILHTEKEARLLLANITAGSISRRHEWNPLVLVGKLVGSMHFGVTIGAQRSFVSTTNDRGLRTLTHIALDLHRARNTALLHL